MWSFLLPAWDCSLENFIVASLTEFCVSQAMGLFTTAVHMPQLASVCGGDLILPGKYFFNLHLSEKGMTSSGHVI